MQLESLPSMVAGISSNDNNLQLEATIQFRKLLSIGKTCSLINHVHDFMNHWPLGTKSTERSPPIEEVIQAGVIPRFVEFLTREDFPQLQV